MAKNKAQLTFFGKQQIRFIIFLCAHLVYNTTQHVFGFNFVILLSNQKSNNNNHNNKVLWLVSEKDKMTIRKQKRRKIPNGKRTILNKNEIFKKTRHNLTPPKKPQLPSAGMPDVSEKQRRKFCGKHALNYLFNGLFVHDAQKVEQMFVVAQKKQRFNLASMCNEANEDCEMCCGYYSDAYIIRVLNQLKQQNIIYCLTCDYKVYKDPKTLFENIMHHVYNAQLFFPCQKKTNPRKLQLSQFHNAIHTTRTNPSFMPLHRVGIIMFYPSHWVALRFDHVCTNQNTSKNGQLLGQCNSYMHMTYFDSVASFGARVIDINSELDALQLFEKVITKFKFVGRLIPFSYTLNCAQ